MVGVVGEWGDGEDIGGLKTWHSFCPHFSFLVLGDYLLSVFDKVQRGCWAQWLIYGIKVQMKLPDDSLFLVWHFITWAIAFIYVLF